MRLISLLFCLFTFPAFGQEMLSQTRVFKGACTTEDMVNHWMIENSFGWKVKAWSDKPINIYGVEIVDVTPIDGHEYWMVGNSYRPDAMIFLGYNSWENKIFYPVPWKFPSKSADDKIYFDLHGSCKVGEAIVFVTWFYTE